MTSEAFEPVRAQELATQRLLQGVSLEAVFGLLTRCPVLTLAPGTCVIEAGRPNHTLYMVLAGQLQVQLDGPDGHEEVGFLEAGQAAGEISILDGGPALRRVLAAEPSRVLAIDEKTFWHLVEVSHDFAINLLRVVTERLRVAHLRSSEATLQRRVIERDAQNDSLTNLFNRRWLDQQLSRLVQRHAFAGDPFSLLLLDIDHFKRFNDDFGHLAGDQVLVAVARTIQRCMRPTDLSARFGGEELVVLMPHTPLAGARVAAERLRAAIAATPTTMTDGTDLPTVTVSIGVAGLEPGESAISLVSRADQLMYGAKHQGRNRVVG